MSNLNTKKYEVDDKALEAVNGGYILIGDTYDSPEKVVFKFGIGSSVEYVILYIGRPFTRQYYVIDRKVDHCLEEDGSDRYCAWYKVSTNRNGSDAEWHPEKEFEHGFSEVNWTW